ncbi:uncharacterized protein TRAVEDRAFT_27793 [Trametes versicolor FP-101664 SS1]|uniref:uncharacterized protein n=1 Tax=Trametes versicolor (strain FP-101664) TaxID=717944 RepID=UPI0004623353|nr:uncharacterized protein TRAVEDRAFT_27793 [Trametes versicolor FP-101664 SS1]EIW60106.1 hypothetical protein TRAVEDRAFT_27793 [Trametes versicolor FP-101664 SS1]
MDVDVDIDGDIEDTRFLPEPHHGTSRSISPAPAKRRLSNAAASSSKARGKEAKSSKNKTSSKKPRRQVVWTDDEDDDFDDPEVVVTDDDDFDPEPDYSSSKKGAKGKMGKAIVGKPSAKSKGGRDKDEKEIIFRDERRLPTTASDPSRRPKAHDEVPVSSAFAADLMDEASLPKKRKLPTIKKNKPSTAGSTAPSTPSAPKPLPAVMEKSQTSRTPAPTSNQVGTRKPAGASADINLLDSSVYSELFKSTQPGVSTPNSGLNRKQKEEERRKELNRMRDEARAKRNADTKNAFDLQASPEKIERFVLHRLRHSTARFPNVLGATFKEMHDRTRVPISTSASTSTPVLAGEQR